MLRSGIRLGEKDQEYGGEKHIIGFLKISQVLSFLGIFVAGVVFGLATSSHINGYFSSPQQQLYSLMNRFTATVRRVENDCHTMLRQSGYNDGMQVDEYCLNMDVYVHPKNLGHTLSDDELFWRASMVPEKDEYPYPRPGKIAFLFLTRGPLPLLPLWEKFFRGHADLFSIYVHALPGYRLNVSSSSVFYGRQIPSQDVSWGTITLLDAERRLLANALLDFSNERFVLLSESCIPIYNFPTVYKYLINSANSFVESYDNPSKQGRGRYSLSMLPNIKLYQWRKGSEWFELNRALAVHIVADTLYYSIFEKYCKPDCYPDEHYIPTYLNLFYGSQNSNRTVTWVDWSFGGPHPALYGETNITEALIQSIRNNSTMCLYNSERTSVCYLFARKFAPSSLDTLLHLSSTVMDF